MVKKLRQILEQEDEWIDVPGPKYGKLPPLGRGERWSYSGVENVPIENMHTIQYKVSKKGVEKYEKGEEEGEIKNPARVHIHTDEEGNEIPYLQDGHHRYVAALRRRKKNILADVWRVVKD